MDHVWTKALSRAVFDEFVGKGVVIAGVGENNIGSALAEGFHFLGSKVTVMGHDPAPLKKLAEQLAHKKIAKTHPLHIIAADLTDEQARKGAVKEACDVAEPVSFISTLGNDKRVEMGDLGQDLFQKLHLINCIVPVSMAADFLEPIRKSGGGCVGLFSSHHGSDLVDPAMMAYGTAKAGLDNAITRLAKIAAALNEPDNAVRVIGLRPGWVQSEAQRLRFPGAFAEAARSQLLPQEMLPHDLVAPVIASVSRVFGGLTSGVTLPIDGGYSSHPVRDRVFPSRA